MHTVTNNSSIEINEYVIDLNLYAAQPNENHHDIGTFGGFTT